MALIPAIHSESCTPHPHPIVKMANPGTPNANLQCYWTSIEEDYQNLGMDAIVQFNTSRSQMLDLENLPACHWATDGYDINQTAQARLSEFRSFNTPSWSQTHQAQQPSRPVIHERLCIDPLLLSTPTTCHSRIPMQATMPWATERSTPNTMSPALPISVGRDRNSHHRSLSNDSCLPSSTSTLRSTFACPICYKTFSYGKDLRRHAITHDPSPPRPFQCPVEGCEYETKGFSRKDVLTRHVKGVHGLQGI